MRAQFTRVKQKPVKEPGEYEVVICSVEERKVSDYNVLRFEVAYSDGVEAIPNYFDIFDVQNPNDSKEVAQFNSRLSKVMDCFNLRGGLDELSIKSWIGKKGKVQIGLDKNGFSVFKKFHINPALMEEGQPVVW